MSTLPGVGAIDHVEMLELLDVRNVHLVGLREVGFSCIFVDGHSFGDQNPSCHMNREHGAWRCKSCGRHGGLIDFVGSARHCSPMEALRWLREHWGDVYAEPRGGSVRAEMQERLLRMGQRSQRVERRLPDEGATIGPQGIFRIDWRSDHPAVAYMVGQRGFSPDALDHHDVGWDSWTRRVTIPVRDEHGRLVGFNARSIQPDHRLRYMVLGDDGQSRQRYDVGYGFDMYEPERYLYGLHDAARALEGRPTRERTLVVVEGELNRVAAYDHGINNVVSVGNAYVSQHQQRLLRSYAANVVLLFDSDDAGRGAVWGSYDPERDRWSPGVVEQLAQFMHVYVVDDHEGDPASMSKQAFCDLLAGARSWLQIATQ